MSAEKVQFRVRIERLVTELLFRYRTLVMHGQVRDLDNETALEFCQRKHEMKGNLISAETKTVMHLRTRRSPDLCDNAIVGAELARRLNLLGNAAEMATGARSNEQWKALAKKI